MNSLVLLLFSTFSVIAQIPHLPKVQLIGSSTNITRTNVIIMPGGSKLTNITTYTVKPLPSNFNNILISWTRDKSLDAFLSYRVITNTVLAATIVSNNTFILPIDKSLEHHVFVTIDVVDEALPRTSNGNLK